VSERIPLILILPARHGKRCFVRAAILHHGGFWKKVGAVVSRSVGLKVDGCSADETSGGSKDGSRGRTKAGRAKPAPRPSPRPRLGEGDHPRFSHRKEGAQRAHQASGTSVRLWEPRPTPLDPRCPAVRRRTQRFPSVANLAW
jgi:hypothetical protein